MMPDVSVLIPARNEQFLTPTVETLLKCGGDIEVVVCLEGYWPDPPLPDDRRLTVIHRGTPTGMRHAINAAAMAARGQWLMKLDAHCLIAEGFDEVLKAECDRDWVVIPRRYSLDEDAWAVQRRRPPMDYHYLSWPYVDPEHPGMHGRWWRERQEARADVLLDDEMTSQGSCWFMHRDHFWGRLGGLQVAGYGDFMQEFQEVGCKTWLLGGAVKVNKRTWYAHLHKGRKHGRGYYLSSRSWREGCRYSADFWVNDRWTARRRDFAWLIEKFWPVPTWPADWRERQHEHERRLARA